MLLMVSSKVNVATLVSGSPVLSQMTLPPECLSKLCCTQGKQAAALWRGSRTPARLTRTGLGIGALLLATSVPYFGYVMAVIGSFLTLTVSVIFPSLCYLKLYDTEIERKEKLLNYFIVALGVFCAVTGTWTSVQSLLKELS